MTIKTLIPEHNRMKELFKDSAWTSALYVHERELIDNFNFPKEPLKDWMSKTGLSSEDLLEFRTNKDKLSVKQFAQIVSNHEFKDTAYQKEWFGSLQEIFLKDPDETEKGIFNTLEINKETPFVQFTYPFVYYSLKRIREKIEEDNLDLNAVTKENITISIVDAIINGSRKLAIKTLIFELNKSRLSNELQGDTPSLRYEYFINLKLSTNESILNFLVDYPVLGRLLAENAKKTIDNIMESVGHYFNDRGQINKEFNVGLNDVKGIEALGDSHVDGKQVLIYYFNSGNKIIYKPHSIAVDGSFNKLLEWFNQFKSIRNFYLTKLISREQYGWVEFINQDHCHSKNEVINFYEQQGQYLAILYMLNATDIHYENIIAKGDSPVIIDLEALFHNEMILNNTGTATNKALHSLSNSIMRTSLLPIVIRNKDVKVDVSGLGHQEDAKHFIYKLVNKNTDEMRFEKALVSIDKKENHPILNNEKQNSVDYAKEIIKGFNTTYELIINEKDFLLSPESPIQYFKNNFVRNIMRTTQSYAVFLESGRHPAYLKNGLDRTRLFDNFWRTVSKSPRFKDIVDSETKDLLNDDIPYFFSKPGERNIYDSRKKSIRFYKDRSFDLVLNTIKGFCDTDKNKQIELIKYSLSSARKVYELTEEDHRNDSTVTLNEHFRYKFGKEDYLNEAQKIADHLAAEAIWGENGEDVTWISLGINEHEKIEYKPMELGLYDGLIGICLFYAYLDKETGNAKYNKLAKACIQSVINEYSDMENIKASISAFTGYSSILYAINHLYRLWKDESLIQFGKRIIDRLIPLIKKDRVFDLLGGNAGVILVSLDFYSMTEYDNALELARKCGYHLVESGCKMEQGLGWLQANRLEGYPLAGLAHGNAGISYALFKLNSYTNTSIFSETALEAVQYENSLYHNDKNNWADLREIERTGEPNFPVYWCNGASGIGLGRLHTLRYYSDNILNNDLKSAIQKTTEDGFKEASHSLCHGDMGNIDFLLSSAVHSKNEDLLNYVYTRSNMILNDVKSKNDKWKCGIPGNGKTTPNLFLGLSGIGYSLLRLYNNNLPSFLILEDYNPEIDGEFVNDSKL